MSRADPADTLAGVRERSRRRLPRPVFDLVEGGAEDEVALRRNSAAFRARGLLPRVLIDAGTRRLDVEVLGTRLAGPVLLAPTGAARVLHRDAELAVARAARSRGGGYVHGTVSGYELERVAAEAPGHVWFQIYPTDDRGRTLAELERAAAAGVRVLVVTVDVPVFGARERDRQHRLTIPLRPSPRLALHCATRPRWTFDVLRGHLPQRPTDRTGRLSPFTTQRRILQSLYPVRPDDLAFLREAWAGPLVVKGVLHPEDARTAVHYGADGVVVSNHGGRQLDRAPATIDALPGVVEAVAGRAEVFLDGGVRRGADVLVALGLGARAVLVGRPYLHGLAAGGQRGVEQVLDILLTEVDRSMALCGLHTLDALPPDLVVAAPDPG